MKIMKKFEKPLITSLPWKYIYSNQKWKIYFFK